MGVTVEDLAFIHAVAAAGARDRAAAVTCSRNAAKLLADVTSLREELETERGERRRVEREGERETLQHQVLEWKARAKRAEEHSLAKAKASDDAVAKAQAEMKKARAEKNGFVKELQRRMEVGGVMMYCIERGSEGIFFPKSELHVQLEAWEEQVERAWEEVKRVKEQLLGAVTKLRESSCRLVNMEAHASALEQAVRSIAREGKKEREGRIEAEKKLEHAREKRLRSESGWENTVDEAKSAVANAKADLESAAKERRRLEEELQSVLRRHSEADEKHRQRVRQLRAVKNRRVAELEKFRLQAKRLKVARKQAHEKDYSKVPHISSLPHNFHSLRLHIYFFIDNKRHHHLMQKYQEDELAL